jgi:hypothetical protein
VITHPEGPAAGAASDAARSQLEVTPDHLERVVRPSSRLSGEQRLALYHRSYQLRLLEAVRKPYPGLRHLLGRDLFDDFALEYIYSRPSRCYTLQRLAAGLPNHLVATRPSFSGQETWPELIVDLARLERTVAEVHDAPGLEGRLVPAPDALPRDLDCQMLADTVEHAGCLRLLRSSFRVGPYLSAVWRGEDPPLPARAESFVAVARRDYVVTLWPLGGAEYELLDRLGRGASIAEAAERTGFAAAAAWRLVVDWTARGFFGARHRGQKSPSDQRSA